MKNGLKGVTDATVFCKSMKKGGPAPMIRSMKSYAAGGAASASAECAGANKPPKCFKKFKSRGRSSETRGGVLSGITAALAGGLGAVAYKKMREKE
jgi:hypothetical protein